MLGRSKGPLDVTVIVVVGEDTLRVFGADVGLREEERVEDLCKTAFSASVPDMAHRKHRQVAQRCKK